jgi:peptidoglycan-N-acetylglucosamine deacetylase
MKTVSFNIDIDPLINYYQIHGLKPDLIDSDPVYHHGIKRFLDMMDKLSIKGTFFITASGIGKNEEKILKLILESGHEIGNHSFSHDYRLTTMNDEKIFEEIKMNHEFIKERTGYECTGFRSPGYNSSSAIISALKKMNYSYDSSLFPSFAYYLAKWMLIKWKKIKGHASKSVISSFSDAFGFYAPEFIDENVKDVKSSGSLVEIPVTTLFAPLGLPLIGTSIIAFPDFLLNILLKVSKKRSFINIEAHGIDLCEVNDSAHFEPLKTLQPDLKYSFAYKIKRFEHVIKFYIDAGYEFRTLSQIAGLKKEGAGF